MDPREALERNGHLSPEHLRPQTYTLAPLPTSTSPSEATESHPHTALSSKDSTNDGSVTPNPEFENSEKVGVVQKRRLTLQHALPAPKRRWNSVLEENLFCEHCHQIDFQKVLDADIFSLQKEDNGILLADLGTRCNDMSTATECHLCHLFHQARLPSKTPSESYQLRVYSYLKSSKAIAFGRCNIEHRAKDIPCLGVVPSGTKGKTFRLEADKVGCLFCLEQGRHDASLFNPRRPNPDADFSQVKDWLNFCTSRHSLCQNRESYVTGLRLLDCETYCVIPAPANATYVALSYVWGIATRQPGKASTKYGRVEDVDSKFTKTICDATVVARALGYKYLWVDKLCIDQDNTEQTHHQITQMDSIYRSADVTIIAACGQDCHYGLPGVNGTPRPSQRVAKVGHVSVFSSMPHPHQLIQSSKWARRGWTLQEAVLSTRRLVFTDEQLYFECNSMHCSENVIPNLNLIHDSQGKIYPCFQSGILSMNVGRRFGGIVPQNSYEKSRLYMSLIVHYTKRALTFEEDRPKAFAGIITHFAKEDIHQLWGVAYYSVSRAIPQQSFTRGLLWAHQRHANQAPSTGLRQDSAIDMTLNLSSSASIPSWSWMAWRGEISFPQSSLRIESEVHNIQLELGPNSWVELKDYLYKNSKASSKFLPAHTTPPKVLRLDVDCVSPSEITLDTSGNLRVHEWETYCYVSRGPLQPKALYELLRSGKLELLGLARNAMTENWYLMIVEYREDSAVRIGLCIVLCDAEELKLGQRKMVRLL